MTTEEAMRHLTEALKSDSEYAFGWHSNIAMCCYDSMDENHTHHEDRLKAGNEAATRFMKLCFGVDTSQNMLLRVPTSERPIR